MNENWRSNPPFSFPSAAEKDLPTIPTSIQPLIILIIRNISVEAVEIIVEVKRSLNIYHARGKLRY